MPTTIIGFLGRGPYSPDGSRKDYYQTQYKFPGWCSAKVPFFLEALVDWLRSSQEKLRTRLVVLGTAGSMWDAFLTRFSQNHQEIEPLWMEVAGRVDQQQVERQDLENIEKIVLVELLVIMKHSKSYF